MIQLTEAEHLVLRSAILDSADVVSAGSSVVATWDDAKALGYCGKGLRQWFDSDRGVTYLEFVQQGVTCEWLRQWDDSMAEKLAAYAEQREMNHGGR